MWDLPRPGLEPLSPALAGRFLTTAPPEKPTFVILLGRLFRAISRVCWLKGIHMFVVLGARYPTDGCEGSVLPCGPCHIPVCRFPQILAGTGYPLLLLLLISCL